MTAVDLNDRRLMDALETMPDRLSEALRLMGSDSIHERRMGRVKLRAIIEIAKAKIERDSA